VNPITTSAPHRIRSAALYLAAWTAVALFYATQWLLYNLYDETPEAGHRIVGVALTDWYVRAAVAVPVLYLARRVPVAEGRRASALAIHALGSVAFALVKIGICWWLGSVLPWLRPIGFLDLLLGEIHLDIATYWILVGLVQWRQSRQRLHEREREAAQLALQTSRLETRLAKAQLDSLKMQLQPHFLFNALHSISALIHEDDEAADLMIVRLGDFLRLVILHAGKQEVSLVEELDFLQRYLEIQQVRFQDRLRVRIDVEPEALEAMVPNLVLQPLVENAIRHAVEPRSSGGRVEVEAKRDGESLCITIRDDGPGIRPGSPGTGLGIPNTRARLEHLYGDRQTLEIANRSGGGAVVTVRFPWHVGATATAA
jgi:two-component system, LytTR family, sensor kinase